MAEQIDEAMVIAWLDGELDEVTAARVAAAVANDPALRTMADAHRAIRARFASAFGPIADEPVTMPSPASAQVVSLAAVRAARAKEVAAPPARRWAIPGAIAASLLVGVLVGHGAFAPNGVVDQAGALALAAPLARALDNQLAGAPGGVRVALSFRDHSGAYCRSFTATHLSGIACRGGDGWQLRYAAPGNAGTGDYRMAGGDTQQAEMVAALIAGEPLDAAAEREARERGWR